MGCTPTGAGCSWVGPPWGHKFCQQTCSRVSSSLFGLTGPARSPLSQDSTRSHPPPGIRLLWRGVLLQLQVDICSTVDLHAGAQPDSRWSSPQATGESPLQHLERLLPLLQRCWCLQSCFSCISSLLSPAAKCHYADVFFLLKYVITESLPQSLIGLALASAGSCLEPAGIRFIVEWGSL